MTDNHDDLIKEWYRFAMMDFDAANHLYNNTVEKEESE